ncbi:MAG: TonB-dependent receptor plug domain-containing protein, partial [Gemmatimonadaceae bacterium]
LSLSGNNGPWGIYLAGTRQFSNMRLEPVATDSSASKILNFHNQGTDTYGFGKLQYAPSPTNVVALDLNASRTHFAVPFDSSETGLQNDHQTDFNAFANLAWHHELGSTKSGATKSDVFVGLFFRRATLRYDADPRDEPQFVFFPDVKDTFNLSEQREANTYGVKADYAYRPSDPLEVKFGTLTSFTSGHENFATFNATGAHGPQSLAGLNGSDVGVYAQTAYTPTELIELRAGLRFDAHTAPFIGTATQLSPRVRLNIYPGSATTLYAYYGRLFMPTNIEDLRAVTSAAVGGQVTQGTEPERDHFFEAGVIRRFSGLGLVTKLSAYHKRSDPGIDDNTVPGSAIVTDVNIAHVRITGIEGVLELRPDSAFSAYANLALNHAYGMGTITGGFFPSSPPSSPAFDLDHDQRLSIVGSATYSLSRAYVSGTVIYGSGLTNGQGPSDCGCSYGTGLFDFNPSIHVAPSTILNLSGGYSIIVKGAVVEPSIYVENVFDRIYVLKGAFFSGPSVGRPRSIQLKLKASI